MITIKLKDTLFASPGGLFYKDGIAKNRAVLHLGSARNDVPLGKLTGKGGQNVLLITTTGTDMEDIMLETLIGNEIYRAAYGVQLIDFVERDYIEVTEDGSVLTATALRTYTAP